ncbi:MAG: hypothetical protein AMXMBFR64_59890 [Myxococcales bacterium]
MRHFRTWARIAVLVLLTALLATAGCRKIKTMTGIGETIESPTPGTPEATVQKVLEAGLESQELAGWEKFQPLLHSSQQTPQSLKNWRQFNFVNLRKKVGFYVKDQAKMSFTIMDEAEGEDQTVTLFLENTASDMPTPCTLQKDKDGSWRITKCSL